MPTLPLNREFKNSIKEIPGEQGFWKAETELLYLDTAVRLLKLGLNEEEVLDLLTNLYSITASEFGG